MRKVVAAIGGFLLVGGLTMSVLSITEAEGPGPIPVCNGEQATIVLVKWQGNLEASLAPYQEWIDAGVVVKAHPSELFSGTEGHDVMVSLVETLAGGFVSNPAPQSDNNPPTAGDFVCSFLKHSDDVYYMNKGRGDYLFDAGGADDYYLGGCRLDGEGSPGDRACDVMIDKGEGGIYTGEFRTMGDSVWTFYVPKGRRTVLREGPAHTHNYVGRGPGKVVVYGGDCYVHIDGERVECTGVVKGNGDHIHPCPVDENTVVDSGLEIKRYQNIVAYDIEYFGPEGLLGLPFRDQVDPCAYQARSR